MSNSTNPEPNFDHLVASAEEASAATRTATEKLQACIHSVTYMHADPEALDLLATALSANPETWEALKELVKHYEC